MELEIGLALLSSAGGIALLTGVINEALKRGWNPTPEQQDRWMPVLNLATGSFLGLLGAGLLPEITRLEIVSGLITGFFGGASAGGLYDLVRGFKKTT